MADPTRKRVETTKRLSLDLGPQAVDRIHRLMLHTEAASQAEVVRQALLHYEYYITHGKVHERPVGDMEGNFPPEPPK